MNHSVSKETQEQSLKLAKATQKKGQSKEQTKLIAQGIEKGIAEYKKQQSKKSRERDKLRKQQIKSKQQQTDQVENKPADTKAKKLPWVLLVCSWLSFIGLALLT